MRVLTTVAPFLGVNCYVVSAAESQECVLIDAGLGGAEGVRAQVEATGLHPVAVLLTHGHPDHVLGLPAYLESWDVPVYLAAADHYRLADPAATMTGDFAAVVARAVPDWPAPVARALPERLSLAGLDFDFTVLPGHTEGSTLIAAGLPDTGETVYFSGDILFAGSVGRTDLPGGSARAMVDSLAVLRGLPDGAVHPGHGPATTMAREQAGNPFLK